MERKDAVPYPRKDPRLPVFSLVKLLVKSLGILILIKIFKDFATLAVGAEEDRILGCDNGGDRREEDGTEEARKRGREGEREERGEAYKKLSFTILL